MLAKNSLTNILPFFLCLLLASVNELRAQDWQEVATMNVIRDVPTSVMLPDDRILIIGGGPNDASPSVSVDIFDYRDNSLTAAANQMEPGVRQSAIVMNDGRVLVVGGASNSGESFKRCYIYDPALDSWSAAAKMVFKREGCRLINLSDGRCLAIGGSWVDPNRRYPKSLASCEIYDPETDSWSAAADLPRHRNGFGALMLPNGQILANNGFNSVDGYDRSCDLYDPESDTWIGTGSFVGEGTGAHAMTLMADGRALRTGGRPVATRVCEIYDSETGIWETMRSLRTERHDHAQVLLSDGRILVSAGTKTYPLGYIGSQYSLKTIEVFSPDLNQWRELQSLPNGISGHSMHLLPNGQVVIIGGFRMSRGQIVSATDKILVSTGIDLLPKVPLSGKVWYDLDQDGQFDEDEQPASAVQLEITPGQFTVTTDAEGNYTAMVPAAAVSVCAKDLRNWDVGWTSSGSDCYALNPKIADGAITDISFGLKARLEIRELDVSVVGTQPIPGQSFSYWVSYTNTGSLPYSGNLRLRLDERLNYLSSSIEPQTRDASSLEWALSEVAVGAGALIRLEFDISDDESLVGEILCAELDYDTYDQANLLRGAGDQFCDVISDSQRLNRLVNNPRGRGVLGELDYEDDLLLNYTLLLQNSGSENVKNARVQIELDEDVDPHSIQLGGSSSGVTYHLNARRTLTFFLNDIDLEPADENSNPATAYLKFYVHPKSPTTSFKQVKVQAKILYDEAAAFESNEVGNVIHAKVISSFGEQGRAAAQYTIQPNPAVNTCFIGNVLESPAAVNIFDLRGASQSAPWQFSGSGVEINTQGLSGGIYCVHLVLADGTSNTLMLQISH